MRKIAVWLLFLFTFLWIFPSETLAATTCSFVGSPSGFGGEIDDYSPGASHTVTFNMGNYPQETYTLVVDESGGGSGLGINTPAFTLGQNGTVSNNNGDVTVNGTTVTWKITNQEALSSRAFGNKTLYVKIYNGTWPTIFSYRCTAGSYTVTQEATESVSTTCDLRIWQIRGGEECGTNGCMIDGGVDTFFEAKNMKKSDGSVFNGVAYIDIGGPGGIYVNQTINASNGSLSGKFSANGIGTYGVIIKENTGTGGLTGEILCPKRTFNAIEECGDVCTPPENLYEATQDGQPIFELCNQVGDPGSEAAGNCRKCFNDGGVWTAIGCIPTEPTSIIQTLITLGLSLGGGVTLLLILAGAFRLSVSAGDPKQAEEAKEQITSAVIGLLFIIFSVVMLRFIGVQVLQIPGFGT